MGYLPTIDAVRSKLDQPLPLGYCNAGEVIESSVEGFSAGDRVVSNGSHAEVVRVNQNLCAQKFQIMLMMNLLLLLSWVQLVYRVLDLLKPTLGECFVVTGLGLDWSSYVFKCCVLMAVEFLELILILKSVKLHREYGAETVDLSNNEDPILISQIFSRGRGVDGVLITLLQSESD